MVSQSIHRVFEELLNQGWIKSARHFVEVDSTNSAAKRSAQHAIDDVPALFVADQQTHGRGRGGHVWWSPSGCLMLTLSITNRFLPENRQLWSQLALLSGVSAAEAIERVCPDLDIQLKWPNDLYLAGKKLGGILIESFGTGSHSRTDSVVAIGIGINVDLDWQNAPPEVACRAVCLTSQTGKSVSRSELLLELIAALSQRIDLWRHDEQGWLQAWHPRCLLCGKIITVTSPTTGSSTSGPLVGRCEGVAHDGCLLVRGANGGIIPVNVGEVLNWQS